MSSKVLFTATALLLAVVFAVAIYVEQGRKAPAPAPAADRPVAAATAQLVRPHAATLGRAEAPVTLVEFLDPACETCALFYPEVKRMLAANPERLRLVMRHVPFHPGSDDVVAMLEASKRQGKYWEALEALLRQQDRWVHNHRASPDDALAVLGGAGIDVARIRADMQQPQVRDAVAQDVADAKALKVTKTPEYFVNGKPLPKFGLDELKTMVNGALRASR
ncbi:MAG TPA: thioredoxin domain-containing protein [Casimicrobiaceae bacterium]|nr:thioredoxin domain-containing protein [Casimicrobiaceae bacterium]